MFPDSLETMNVLCANYQNGTQVYVPGEAFPQQKVADASPNNGKKRSKKVDKDQPRPFKCAVCSRSFKHQGHLRQHEVTHVVEGREFQCLLCKKRFHQLGHLTLHYYKKHRVSG